MPSQGVLLIKLLGQACSKNSCWINELPHQLNTLLSQIQVIFTNVFTLSPATVWLLMQRGIPILN